VPIFLEALGLGHHHVDRAEIARLDDDHRHLVGREDRARRGQHGHLGVDARQRGFELRGGQCRGSSRGRWRRALCRMALLQLEAGAMRELVQLECGATARIAQDLGGPGE
jgi:hypothetical protein